MLTITYSYSGSHFTIIDIEGHKNQYDTINEVYKYQYHKTIQDILSLFIKYDRLIVTNYYIRLPEKATIIQASCIDELISKIKQIDDNYYIIKDIIKRDDSYTIEIISLLETFFSDMFLPILRKKILDEIINDLC